MQNTLFVKADDIAEILNISQSKAYSIIKSINKLVMTVVIIGIRNYDGL